MGDLFNNDSFSTSVYSELMEPLSLIGLPVKFGDTDSLARWDNFGSGFVFEELGRLNNVRFKEDHTGMGVTRWGERLFFDGRLVSQTVFVSDLYDNVSVDQILTNVSDDDLYEIHKYVVTEYVNFL